ncbi:MAG: SAM hydrolase/SAM-dependent halogenase family protein [Candidatus Binatia bacterium]
MRPSGIITLLTDFGTRDAYVGIMKGVALGICPAARLVDLTHAVPPQAVGLGALVLRSALDAFPDGTVHLAVVDPGVGSARAPVAVVTARAILVGPDNGLLAPSAAHLGVTAVYRLEAPAYFRQPVSQTFHGRDVFAPVAAHLAAGLDPSLLGPPGALQAMDLAAPRQVDDALHGEVVYVDHFGNLVTNLPAAALRTFRASRVSVRIAEMTIAGLVSSYAAAAPGAPLAIIGSWDLLEVAVRDGDAAARLQVGIGAPVAVTAG